MAPTKEEQSKDLYGSIMAEVKGRLIVFETLLGPEAPSLFGAAIINDFCFIQFRMICELISLGCLVAHGDITSGRGKWLLTQYKADKIVEEMGRLHSDFFPRAVNMTITPPQEGRNGNIQIVDKDVVDKTSKHLTRAELVTLYKLCNEALHRGSVAKLLRSEPVRPLRREEIIEWHTKIIRLLEQHSIASKDNLTHWICALSDASTGGLVRVLLVQAPQRERSAPSPASSKGQ